MRNSVRRTATAICYLMLLAATMPATASEWLSHDVQSQLARSNMSGDLFQRLNAIGDEAQAQGIPIGKTLRQAWRSSDQPSIETMAGSLQDHAAIASLLDEHGLSAQDFVTGMLMLERSQYAAAGLIDKQKLNPQNLRFYDQHKTQADKALARLLSAGSTTDNSADDPNSHDLTLEDLQKMDKQMLAECTQVGLVVAQAVFSFGIAAMDSHHPEAGNISGDTIIKISENLHDLAADVPQEDLKGYLSTMSGEIRRQAHNRPIQESPAYLQAGDAYTAWMDNHCTKETLTQ